MITNRQLFFSHVAQTSGSPLSLEIEKAEGLYLYGRDGKRYMDLISGISVSTLGHCHPSVVKAVERQIKKYMHLMVYGEYIQTPQVLMAKMLHDHLPGSLSTTFFVNSGSEATEGALKLAKRYTGRAGVVSFTNAYHGSTHGSLSIIGRETYKRPFRPLLPGVTTLPFNSTDGLESITNKTACVIAETIQGEAGVIKPDRAFMQALRRRCDETGALLILDEVQAGMGRTGRLWGFGHYDIIPDIMTLAKGVGGGMPLGAFISSEEIMQSLTENPVLGHITTFGGHPVSCAAAAESFKVLLEEGLTEKVTQKEQLFRKHLSHHAIKDLRTAGLLIALEFDSFESNKKVIDQCIRSGMVTDWFLFAPHCLRIAPPLIMEEPEIIHACETINTCIDDVL